MPSITYSVGYSPLLLSNAKFSLDQGNDFINKVDQILEDERGWKKYGYEFVRSNTTADYILHIELASAEKVKTVCGNPKLSCYIPSSHTALINYDNWSGLAAIMQEDPPGMTLDEYQCYVINHEVGHGLGLRHPLHYNKNSESQCDPERNGLPGSVMMQMTKGTYFISPCVPNCWPLDPTEYDEMVNLIPPTTALDYRGIKLEHQSEMQKYVALAFIVIFLVLLIIVYMKKPSESFSKLQKSHTRTFRIPSSA